MPLPDTSDVVGELPRPLQPMLAPLKKLPMGLACGAVLALALFLLALYHWQWDQESAAVKWVWLLGNNYFRGYSPEPAGAVIGLGWGFVAGFAFGWCLAAARNLMIAIYVFVVGARERLRANRDVLDDLM